MNWYQDLIEILKTPAVHIPLIIICSIILGGIAKFIISIIANRITKKTRNAIDDQVLETIKQPVALTILLVGCWLALTLCDLPASIITTGKSFILTITVCIWTLALLRIATIAIEALSLRDDIFQFIQPKTKPVLLMTSKTVIIAASLYFLSKAWNSDVTAWLASAGIVGIAVGFAAKDTLANLFAGVFIIADAPYKLGDYVVLDNSIRGLVTHIGLRSTRILTRDDVEVIVPNGIIGNSTIVNESGGPYEKFRVRLDIGVAYGSDIDKVQEIILNVAQAETIVEASPAARVRFRSFGDSALELQLLFWVAKPELRGLAEHTLNIAVYKALAENDIEIPYPKRDVYMHEVAS